MAEPERKRLRLSPRTSSVAPETTRIPNTPYNDLHALASIIHQKPTTPHRRAVSAEPTSSAQPLRRTPGTGGNRTPATGGQTPHSNLLTRQFVVRRGAPTTPHAIRALQQRRNAALTPRAQRRRSGRLQRETPRDTLRALSRVMAKKSQPVQPALDEREETRPRNPALEDFDEGPDVVPPRLSLALDDDDDDSFHVPPRLSNAAMEDLDDLTSHSFEAGRRALSEDPRHRFSIGGRLSERFGEFNELGSPEIEIDGTFIRSNLPAAGDDIIIEDGTVQFGDDTTGEISALLGRRRRSGLDLGEGVDDETQDEPTFQFRIPQRARVPPSVPEGATEDDEDAPQLGGDVENWEDEDEIQALGDAAAPDEQSRFALPRLGDSSLDIPDAGAPSARAEKLPQAASGPKPKRVRKPKELKFSKHGIQYPSLPPTVVKKLAIGFLRQHGHSNPRISKDVLGEIMQTSDWFFEQLGWDLAEYASHAKRKKIEEADVVCLMKRQRQLNANTTAFSLAQRYLPRELLQDIRMAPPEKLKKTKRKRLETIEEVEDEEI